MWVARCTLSHIHVYRRNRTGIKVQTDGLIFRQVSLSLHHTMYLDYKSNILDRDAKSD